MHSTVVEIQKREAYRERSDKTHVGLDKIARYGWNMTDQPGEFAWINKNDLEVDHSYQREDKEFTARNIASDFSWAAFGALQVAMRREPSGRVRYAIFDGQNRWEGAMRRSDITAVPCIVYEIASVSKEAEAFLTTNVGRKAVSALEKHKASVMTGDEASVLLNNLVAGSGYKISNSTKPGTLKCVALCKRLIATDADVFSNVFDAVVYIVDGGPVHERLLGGLFYLQRNADQDVLTEHFVQKMKRIGATELLDAINKAAAYYSRGGPKIFADGLMQRINKGARTNLITIGAGEAA